MAFFRTFKSFEDITTDYESGQLHPKDLKDALSKALNKILQVSISFCCNNTVIILPPRGD